MAVCATCQQEIPRPPGNITVDDNKRGDVLLKLLEQNRTEIRCWNERLFTASFWVAAAILGIVGFVLKEDTLTPELRVLAACGVGALALFHLSIAWRARSHVSTNGDGLVKIQRALLLTDHGAYRAGECIYEDKPFPKGWRWWYLDFLNGLLGLGALGVLLWPWVGPWVMVAACRVAPN
jgi:hypothetical protein